MPSREWRKCGTCEWYDEKRRCHNEKVRLRLNLIDALLLDKDIIEDCGKEVVYCDRLPEHSWCSEWKSAEPETCGMCEWFFPLGDRLKGVCNHSMARPRNYISYLGACKHFRRKDAD